MRFRYLPDFLISLSLFLCFTSEMKAADVNFKLAGLEQGDKATVSVSSSEYLETMSLEANGDYAFKDVPPGRHTVKVEATGYNLPNAQLVDVHEDGSVDPMTGINVVITKMSEDPNEWTHHWEQDGSVSGYTTTANVNKRPEVEFLGKRIVPADVPSMQILLDNYKVLLSDEDEPWTQEYAYRLLETLKTLPVSYDQMKVSKFTLTSSRLTDDITVSDMGDAKEVSISKEAFYYANPFLVSLDGVRGRFFSKRLHHAMTKFVSDFGNEKWIINQILESRFGCSINVPDYEELTGQHPGNFQDFYPSELVALVNMFEEMPEGFHKVPGLNYLVRRQDGHPNPDMPDAVGIAYTGAGYIEFINAPHLQLTAFSGNNENFETQRIILHEKTHFLWANVFSEEIKNEWIEIGGWYKDPNADPKNPDAGWATTKDTEFVTAYAHAKNPDEDMAESVAYYLKDPDKLLARSTAKYEFLQNKVMHGVRYISSIPDYLTFEVLNLYPDYDFPGKISKVDVKVYGAPEEDKLVTFDIYLNHMEGYQDGANSAYFNINSPYFKDDEGNEMYEPLPIWANPVDGDLWHLRGSATISKYSKAGYWTPGDIVLSDIVGNERFEGRNDCVVTVYVNNPLEDLIAPKYEKGSLTYELSDIDYMGHHEQLLSVKINAYDNIGIDGVYGGLYTGVDSNHMPGWSTVVDEDNKTIEIQYRIRDYFYSTEYHIAHIGITDLGGVNKDIRFDEDPGHEPVQKIYIETPTPDYEPAEVDLNRIYVHAEPTIPEAPNGETLVNIVYYVRDNISGMSSSAVTLLDPQGNRHFYWAANGKTDEAGYFLGDPTAWTRYEANIVLPVGSAPGIWGIAEMNLRDNAFNDYTYNFVETLIFEPEDDESQYVLFAEMTDDELLIVGLDCLSQNNYGFTYRIINEETGQEISGKYSATRASYMTTQINVSALDDGNLVVIVTALDENGNPLSVKSTTITKGDSSGVNKVKNENRNIKVTVSGGYMAFNGIEDDEIIRVYSIAGNLVFEGNRSRIETTRFDKDVYVVAIGKDILKIAIK